MASRVLDVILTEHAPAAADPRLLVGSDGKDDAAVYDLGDGTALVSTTDFFTPIVDDPFDFGRIAAVNSISDVYAMGALPLVAISVLGWPVDRLSPEVANQVVEGARNACREAGISLAGGHSIDNPEPIFGLAVTGTVRIEHIKRNDGGRPGDLLFLTKPLGVGILTTAEKRGVLEAPHATLARDVMVRLNKIGPILAKYPWVHAMTDVTGFGFLGHLVEMCEGSGFSARVEFARVPLLEPDAIDKYLGLRCVPGGTGRNRDGYGSRVGPISGRQGNILFDPQTSGGLLVAVDPQAEAEFQDLWREQGQGPLPPLGRLVPQAEPLISVT